MLARLGAATVMALAVMALARPAEARVDIHVDLASQTMRVDSESGSYEWPISSARSGYRTPRGSFRVQRMEVMHRSHKYHNSPMPHSLFFAGGYAIHGTYATAALGQPASHGCIRIAPENAAALYEMVAAEGARISIEGTSPSATRYAEREQVRYARRHGTMVAIRHHRRDDSDGDAEEMPENAFGYAPLRAPSVRTWLDDLGDF